MLLLPCWHFIFLILAHFEIVNCRFDLFFLCIFDRACVCTYLSIRAIYSFYFVRNLTSTDFCCFLLCDLFFCIPRSSNHFAKGAELHLLLFFIRPGLRLSKLQPVGQIWPRSCFCLGPTELRMFFIFLKYSKQTKQAQTKIHICDRGEVVYKAFAVCAIYRKVGQLQYTLKPMATCFLSFCSYSSLLLLSGLFLPFISVASVLLKF